jgi:hypothetical protein
MVRGLSMAPKASDFCDDKGIFLLYGSALNGSKSLAPDVAPNVAGKTYGLIVASDSRCGRER